ncbi:MAG: uridine diphosphate-N-acetylglucosamine-binding protein YvcK [Anaerolineae bacterium]
MRRWVFRSSWTRWLRIGIGVKRWLLLLVGGIVALCVATALFQCATGPVGWMAFIKEAGLLPVPPVLAASLLAVLGSIMVAVAVYRLNLSLLAAFRRRDQTEVVDVVLRHRARQRGPRVVAIGGGHGLNTLLRGLKEYTDHITAIVTVADDGGSSGRLRRELGILPPGDFRNCIAALSDAEELITGLFQYRFQENGHLDGHSFGNLYLSAMTALTGSFEAALAESSRVLAVRGRVLPSTLAQVTLEAEVGFGVGGAASDHIETWRRVRGESAIAAARGRIRRIAIDPEDAPAYPEAIRAILDADLIVAGPGSLYTSVLPNLLVRDLAEAIMAAQGLKVYVCNVATQLGETEGYDVQAHVRALQDHVGASLFRTVLANNAFVGPAPPGQGVEWVRPPEREPRDYRLILRDLVDRQQPWRHDPHKLAQALLELLNP